MKKSYVIFGIGVLVVVGVIASRSLDKNDYEALVHPAAEQHKVSHGIEEVDSHARVNGISPTDGVDKWETLVDEMNMDERVARMSERRFNQSFDKEAVQHVMESDKAWEVASSQHMDLPLSEEQRNDGRVFIELDPLRIEALMVNDTLNVELPGVDESVSVLVQEVQGKGRSLQWKGSIIDDQGWFHITKGRALTVGTINTSHGQFEFQIHGDKGWIVSTKILSAVDSDVRDDIPSAPSAHSHDHAHPHHH